MTLIWQLLASNWELLQYPSKTHRKRNYIKISITDSLFLRVTRFEI